MNVHRCSPSFANIKPGFIRRFTVNVSENQRKIDYDSENQKRNHYDSLGVTPKATQGDIKSAYYKLSKEYHPDLNKDDEAAAEKFRNITAAYEVLGNVKSRKVYDRGLLVGSYPHEPEREAEPADSYPHASFYHHRNKPTSKKTSTGTSTNYNIDEWTKAHYSKTFHKTYDVRNRSRVYKADTDTDEKDIWRNLPALSLIVIVSMVFLTYGAEASKKFDRPSKINDKPD